MSTADDDLFDPFLHETDSGDVLCTLAGTGGRVEPSPGLRSRILQSATKDGRLARFADAAAQLLDLPVTAARALLARLDEPASWSTGLSSGMSFFHVTGGPRVQGAVTGFVRIVAGQGFPEHEHLGDEEVLIVQGTCMDSSSHAVVSPGCRIGMASGTTHRLEVRPGPDLLYLAVVFRGIRVGEQELLADDPRI